MTTPRYLASNAWPAERQRLVALEQRLDPGTIRRLQALGVGEGWRCLEAGAGAGSIAAWLCRRVGVAGRVVATDLDTRFLEGLDQPQLEVRRHNLVSDALEEGAFDLVHARALLTHLAGQPAALATALGKLVAALKPGGWLLAEEIDNVSLVTDPRCGERFRDLLARYRAASEAAVQAAGGDLYYGRRLYGDVCALGLTEVEADGRAAMIRGGAPVASLRRLTLAQLRERVIASGQLSAADVDELGRLFDSPDALWLSETVIAVWGRRPTA